MEHFQLLLIRKDQAYPEDLVQQIAEVDWAAGSFLANRIRQGDLAPTDSILVVTTSTGRLAGFVGLTERDIVDGLVGPFLSTLYVVPEQRGQGLSRYLIEQVLQLAIKQACKELYTVTQQVGLYEPYHFQQVDEVFDRLGRPMRLLKRDL